MGLSAKLGRLGVEDFFGFVYVFFSDHDFDWAYCGSVCVDWVLRRNRVGG